MKASILRAQDGAHRVWVVTTGWATTIGAPGRGMAQVVSGFELAHGKPDEGYVRVSLTCRLADLWVHEAQLRQLYSRCRVCSCTNDDCRQCVEATGRACSWVVGEDPPICSRCHDEQRAALVAAAEGGAE